MNDKRYTKGEEYINSISHGVGVLMSLVVGIVFLVYAYRYGDSLTIMSFWLYMFGVVSSYLFSTIYHACPQKHHKCRRWLRKLDHSAIYWHIAACYSPLTLVALRDVWYWGWGIFFFVWLCAIAGTIVSLISLKKHNFVETACYVLMGLTILVAIKPFYENVDFWILFWVIAEGVSYITGAVLYSLHKVKYIHSVFHFFVILGDVCHIIALWRLIDIYLIA
ncbi:MAG: hemolysin III family protein [Bacteroidaceae bacterium]|nr:hemolysin III family protein [Bacteroidaceae bacterium]